MPQQHPSIQSFYAPVRAQQHETKCATDYPQTSTTRDGFSSDEITAVTEPSDPIDMPWTPGEEYEDVELGGLIPGPQRITFQARIVNLHRQAMTSQRPRAATGCYKLIVKDDSGFMTIRLWSAQQDYKLHLGQLVSVWVVHISNGIQGNFSTLVAPLVASLFPERDRTCHIMVHEHSDNGVVATIPEGYREGRPYDGLMSLKTFIDGGHDITTANILVCVKSIGARKKITNKKQVTSELVNVNVFDDSAEGTLTLWDIAAFSATSWKPSSTVLLISGPGWRKDNKIRISLTGDTTVEVNPSMGAADWLRRFAQRLIKREHINPPFPSNEALNFETAQEAINQIFFRLSDLDDFARAMPAGEAFFGYLSLTILELKLSTLHIRQMLMCNECCGVPIFANALSAKCRQCDKVVMLAVNPRALASASDETGNLGAGAINMHADAWEELFGATIDGLCRGSTDGAQAVEQRLLYARRIFWFGWKSDEPDEIRGRVCVRKVLNVGHH